VPSYRCTSADASDAYPCGPLVRMASYEAKIDARDERREGA